MTSLFYKHKRMKDGFFNHCIECHKAYGKKWNLENQERRKEIRLKSYFPREYGITLDRYNEMREEQECSCKICKTPESQSLNGRLYVDHCHSSKEVRGLLCHSCNTALGHFRDDISNLTAAIEYLRNNS